MLSRRAAGGQQEAPNLALQRTQPLDSNEFHRAQVVDYSSHHAVLA